MPEITPTTNTSETSRGIPFREFLDKSTNLLTIFGIFNALSVYAATIDEQPTFVLVAPVFIVLSIIVWWQVIMLSIDSNNGSKIYEAFILLIGMAQIGLVGYFIITYALLLLLLGALAIFFLCILLLQKLTLRWVGSWMAKWAYKKGPEQKEKRIKRILFWHFVVLLLPAALMTLLTFRLITPIVKKIVPGSVWELPDKHSISDSTDKK